MKACFFLLLLFTLLSCSTTRYYIVRHAEKESTTSMMSSDVPLSENGKRRAIALKDVLLPKKIKHIFSTNYSRTRATAQPLSAATGVAIQLYDTADSTFPATLKHIRKGNVLIVGHSNTVDNLVNALTGKALLQDLPDAQYGDLFIVTKRGRKYSYSKGQFGL
jgi:2,3-bisphosphoglycerate-dependent phosphoglycerate mutase